MGKVASEKIIQLELTLTELKGAVDAIKKVSNDSILIWHLREVEDWINYLKNQTDIEEMHSLKSEIYERFYTKYNVRIEPKSLDEKRLTIFEKLLGQLNEI